MVRRRKRVEKGPKEETTIPILPFFSERSGEGPELCFKNPCFGEALIISRKKKQELNKLVSEKQKESPFFSEMIPEKKEEIVHLGMICLK